MLIGRMREHACAQPFVQHVFRIGQILRDLLLDCAALQIPILLTVQHVLHARSLDVQRDIQILGRHREQILRQALARVGVEVAAHDAADVGKLIGRQAGAAAKHHVLLRMCGAGKAWRGLIRADQIVDRGAHYLSLIHI